MGRRQVLDEALQRRGVLPAQGLLELPAPLAVDLQLLQDAAEEVGLAHVDLEAVEAQGLEPFHRHRDHLGVGLGLLEPDQLDPRLVELPVPSHLGFLVAEDVRHVGEPEGLGLVAEAGGDDAGDLGGDVGPERKHPPRVPVHELEHLSLEGLVGPHREDVGELVGRRHHLAVAPAGEDGEEALLDAPLGGGLVGQVDLDPLGQLGLEGTLLHTGSQP